MKDSLVNLRHNIRIEPLIWQWYAWSYLIAPVSCVKLMHKHIRLMDSYLSAPEIHHHAATNKNLLGGTFINLPFSSYEKVKTLYKHQSSVCESLIELADQFKKFDLQLLSLATGYSLENLYRHLPEIFSGCVELVYDHNDHPSIRIIENLFYKNFYPLIRQAQGFALLDADDPRPFSFSTPRLTEDTIYYFEKPFDDKSIDYLMSMRTIPRRLSETIDILGLSGLDEVSLNTIFRKALPKINQSFSSPGIRIRYFGHACVLIETKDVSILIDPLINNAMNAECFSFADLPDEIDYVLITHGHQDHFVLETLFQIRYKVKQIVVPRNNSGSYIDPSLKLILRYTGFNNIIDIEEFESIDIAGGTILSIPFLGEHADLGISAKTAYSINLYNKQFLFCADSNNLDNKLYEYIYKYIGAVDYLFLGMECQGAPMNWFFSPLLNKLPSKENSDSRRFSGSDCDKACQIVETLKCKNVFVYAMAMEPWLAHIMAIEYDEESLQLKESDKFIHWCKSKGIEASRPFLKMEITV